MPYELFTSKLSGLRTAMFWIHALASVFSSHLCMHIHAHTPHPSHARLAVKARLPSLAGTRSSLPSASTLRRRPPTLPSCAPPPRSAPRCVRPRARFQLTQPGTSLLLAEGTFHLSSLVTVYSSNLLFFSAYAMYFFFDDPRLRTLSSSKNSRYSPPG